MGLTGDQAIYPEPLDLEERRSPEGRRDRFFSMPDRFWRARVSLPGSRRVLRHSTVNVTWPSVDCRNRPCQRGVRSQDRETLNKTVTPPQGIRGIAAEMTDHGTRSITAVGVADRKWRIILLAVRAVCCYPVACGRSNLVVVGWNRRGALCFACRDCTATLSSDVGHSEGVTGRPEGRPDQCSCNTRSI